MKQANNPHSTLRPQGAFVVQFHADAEVGERRISGRIDHLMSGDSAPFDSLEMMLAFVAKHKGAGNENGT